jgi:hypothetical protein
MLASQPRQNLRAASTAAAPWAAVSRRSVARSVPRACASSWLWPISQRSSRAGSNSG